MIANSQQNSADADNLDEERTDVEETVHTRVRTERETRAQYLYLLIYMPPLSHTHVWKSLFRLAVIHDEPPLK